MAVLERELGGKDKMFRGAVAPQFFMSNGSEARVPRWRAGSSSEGGGIDLCSGYGCGPDAGIAAGAG